MHKIAKGRTAEIFAYNEHEILKLFYKHVHSPSVEQEYNTALKIHQAGIPTARPIKRVMEKERIGIVYEHIQGKTVLDLLSSHPFRVKSYAKTCAHLHAMIHRIQMDALPEITESLKSVIKTIEILSDQEKTSLINFLNQRQKSNAICHGDFHPDNIIMQGDHAIIIDWMNAVKGPAVADVARTVVLLEFAAPEKTKGMMIVALKWMRKLFLKHYLKTYQHLHPLNEDELMHWKLVMAAARLKEKIPEPEKQALLEYVKTTIKKSLD